MAPKTSKNRSLPSDPHGIFSGMVVFLVDNGVQRRRLQIWKQKLVQMGAIVEEESLSRNLTHVFAVNSDSFCQKFVPKLLQRFKGTILLYQWLEDSLRLGEKVSEESYTIQLGSCQNAPKTLSNENSVEHADVKKCSDNQLHLYKKLKSSPNNSESSGPEVKDKSLNDSVDGVPHIACSSKNSSYSQSPSSISPVTPDTQQSTVSASDASLPYHPPDLNRNITEIFGKLINIYRALGDDRRSFSYYKAIPVIERLPFKIESVDQVKDLPAIGKSMQDHIHEIVTTGKLSKLEHFESDEKVWTISLFGEVWGIGPATALKLYEKGHRSLDDLKSDDTLTNSQRLGLKYFEDIRTRIPRDEVQEMEHLLQKAAADVVPAVTVVCGGSFRRGKASCGDMDIVITHPDGERYRSPLILQVEGILSFINTKEDPHLLSQMKGMLIVLSHVGFLPKYVNHLKDMNFLREDLVFSIHSEQGTDSGVDTYFGLCTYPGRELRHRIDLKVYPKDIYPFGLIHWTGNDVLNRRLRLLAESKGFLLDDTGLFPATHGSGGKRVSASTSLKFNSEKEVFDFLGFPWLEPHERNI